MAGFDPLSLLAGEYGALIWRGLATTLALFSASLGLGLAGALLLMVIRALPFRPAGWAVAVIVEYHRNVPLLVQIMVWYFGMPQALPEGLRVWVNAHDTEFIFAVVALALNGAAYMSEDLRSGIRAIPPTQSEAARSLGLGYLQTMRWVIAPQALRIAGPPLINQTLMLCKSTSLAMAIGVGELTYRVREIEDATFRAFDVYAVSTVLYLLLALLLMGLGAWVARRYPPAFKA